MPVKLILLPKFLSVMLTRSRANSQSIFMFLEKNPRKNVTTHKTTNNYLFTTLLGLTINIGIICYATRNHWLRYANTNFSLV